MANDPLLVVTPKATLSYPHLDVAQEPQKGSTGKPKYSGTFVFPEGSDLSTLQAAATAAGEAKWPGKFLDMVRVGAAKSPFRRDAEAKGYKPGSVFVNARSEQRPGCVYTHAIGGTGPDAKKPATIPADKVKEELYPGAQVRAQFRAFAYDTNGNKGVSFALNNVQKLGDGDRLDNRQAAEDAFEADLSAAPADLSGLL